jgi:hypothetical protein
MIYNLDVIPAFRQLAATARSPHIPNRIQHEGSIVLRMMLMSPTRLSVVFPSCLTRLPVELLYRLSIRASECDVCSSYTTAFFGKYPEHDIQTTRTEAHTVIMELFLFAVAERCERGYVPGGDLFKPGWRDCDADVVKHSGSEEQENE